MINIKLVKLGILMFLAGLAVWLFFWPLVECFYALSLDPLLSAPSHKQGGFVVGLIVFIVAVITGKSLIT